MFDLDQWTVLLTVIGIDIILSGDNAIIIGTAAARLPPEARRKAIAYGIAGAAIMRIFFAIIAFYLLQVIGLLLAGGLLLLWVTWTMWRELHADDVLLEPAELVSNSAEPALQNIGWKSKAFRSAIYTILIADVSMSLDNVLAVTGAAHNHMYILIFGLALSIALMAVAANWVAGLLSRYHWLMYLGIALVFLVAIDMIWRGGIEVGNAMEWIG